jgi:hypothetical protein
MRGIESYGGEDQGVKAESRENVSKEYKEHF